jgi:hypothetical protein
MDGIGFAGPGGGAAGGRAQEGEETSTIGDELREWACAHASDVGKRELGRIADRIDAEMVELPVGADGRPIRPEEAAYLKDGSEFLVAVLKLTDCGWMAYRPGDHVSRSPGDLYHERPDSWERIADELDAWCDRTDVDGDACGKPRELARRIRRLAERKADGR